MNKNIKDYAKNSRQSSNNTSNSNNSNINNSGQNIENDVNKYSKYSENQLMQEMMNVASREKKNGSLTPQALDSFYNSMAPNLSNEQRNKLKSLIKQLK